MIEVSHTPAIVVHTMAFTHTALLHSFLPPLSTVSTTNPPRMHADANRSTHKLVAAATVSIGAFQFRRD
jgi:hypothetical protein